MTHSLLSSWIYTMKDNDRDTMDDFMRVLRREPSPPTEAMQRGIDFEDMVTDILHGKDISEKEKWYGPAKKIAGIMDGAFLQCKLHTPITVDGTDLLLYGRLDGLRGGNIYDIKFTTSYDRGKFQSSTQHPVYMLLVPEARAFEYLITNGTDLWTECYRRDEIHDIIPDISDFLKWIKNMGVEDVYHDNWQSLWGTGDGFSKGA